MEKQITEEEREKAQAELEAFFTAFSEMLDRWFPDDTPPKTAAATV